MKDMSEEVVLKVDHISKQYRLGQVGTGTISHDLKRFVYRLRGKEDPFLKVGAVNDRESKKSDGYVWALEDVNFELKKGEVLGIIGKNGAGKSTLLKILSRITGPSKGSISVKGRISSLLEVGTGFHPELTGRENVFLNGAILGMTKKEVSDKLDEIVDFSGCAAYIDTPTKRYSSGMIVRLGFAVAAYLESEILVVDEVLAVGDIEFQKKCIGKMQDISASGRTVLFVSHNLNSVKSLCTKGLLIDKGRSQYFGDIDTTIEKYLDSGSLNAQNSIDLTNFDGRQGNGLMRFKKVELFVNGKPGNKMFTGDSLKLKMVLNAPQKTRYKVAVHLYRADETRLSNITSMDSGVMLEPFVGEKTLEIEFDKIMFYTDIYKISLWVGDMTTHEHIDYLKHCCEFEIVEGSRIIDRSLPKTTGIFFMQPSWQFLD